MTPSPRRPKRPDTPPALPPPPPPARSALAVPVVIDWEKIRDAFVVGEETGSLDQASGAPIRRWPALRELADRFSVPFESLEARSVVDGWDARKGAFVAGLERSRQRAIQDRIASQDANARLAYVGIHNDLIRGLGRIVQAGIPAQVPANGSGCSFLPRDLKVIADTTLACAEIMGAAQGRMKGTESPLTLAVQVAHAQALGVPVPSLSPAMQASLAPVAAKDAGINTTSLWSVLIEARRGPVPKADPYDSPSPLSPALSSTR